MLRIYRCSVAIYLRPLRRMIAMSGTPAERVEVIMPGAQRMPTVVRRIEAAAFDGRLQDLGDLAAGDSLLWLGGLIESRE